MPLLAGVDHEVQRQLLLALERLLTDRADVRPLRVVRLLVPGEVVLALQGGVADVADESVAKDTRSELEPTTTYQSEFVKKVLSLDFRRVTPQSKQGPYRRQHALANCSLCATLWKLTFAAELAR